MRFFQKYGFVICHQFFVWIVMVLCLYIKFLNLIKLNPICKFYLGRGPFMLMIGFGMTVIRNDMPTRNFLTQIVIFVKLAGKLHRIYQTQCKFLFTILYIGMVKSFLTIVPFVNNTGLIQEKMILIFDVMNASWLAKFYSMIKCISTFILIRIY